MKLSGKHVFYAMSASLVILVLAIVGCTYLASSMLSDRAKKLSDLKVTNAVLDQEAQGLAKAKQDTATYKPLQTIAKTIVPQDKDQAQAVREIVKLAAASGITPSSISFPASTLGAKAVGTATGTTVPVTGGASASKLTQLTPVKGSPGLYVMQITISQDSSTPVPYSKFIDFLNRLEQNRRTALVSNIVLQPSTKDRNQLSFTLTLNEYIKP